MHSEEDKTGISLVQPVYLVPVRLMELHATAQKFIDAGQMKCFQIHQAIRHGGEIADAGEKIIQREMRMEVTAVAPVQNDEALARL